MLGVVKKGLPGGRHGFQASKAERTAKSVESVQR